jgi:hypothetical protein
VSDPTVAQILETMVASITDDTSHSYIVRWTAPTLPRAHEVMSGLAGAITRGIFTGLLHPEVANRLSLRDDGNVVTLTLERIKK